MVGKPKSDVPSNSNPQGLELSEMVGLFFSFVWFYRGVLLAALVLYGLYHILTMASDKVAENKRRDNEAPAFVYVPEPAENMSLSQSESGGAAVPSIRQPSVRRPERTKVAAPVDPKTARFREFMLTASVESLFRRFAALMREVPAVDSLGAIGNIRKCQQICVRLRRSELTAEQQEMLLTLELESVSQLDAINVQHDMQMPGVRDQLIDATSNLLQHPSVAVSAKAHLAVFAGHAVDLMFTPTREELRALINVYDAHADGIIRGETEPLVVADLLQQLVDRHQFDEVIALRRDWTTRMLSDGVMDLEKMNSSLKEQVVFGDLGLGTLLSRIDGMSETAMQDVELFYQRLERFPNARKKVFQLALAVIDRRLADGKLEQASGLLSVLKRIQSQISDVEIKDWLGEDLAEINGRMDELQLTQ